jgi:hypothetical protein
MSLSERVRDAMLSSITVPAASRAGPGRRRSTTAAQPTPASAAVALAAALDDDSPALTTTENALLRDWLTRIANPQPGRR